MQPCWILCTPRTGSSYLCELLNNSGCFPNFKHPKLKPHKGPIQQDRAFNEWLRIYRNEKEFEKDPPATCKAIYHQFIEVLTGSIQRRGPGEEGYLVKTPPRPKNCNPSYLENLIPNIKFIHLTRGVIEQSVSVYIARKTKKYHIYDKEQLKNYFKQKIEINTRTLLDVYYEVTEWNKIWADFKGLNVCYEDLMTQPDRSLNLILEYLQIKPIKPAGVVVSETNDQERILKMTRPENNNLSKILLSLLKKV